VTTLRYIGGPHDGHSERVAAVPQLVRVPVVREVLHQCGEDAAPFNELTHFAIYRVNDTATEACYMGQVPAEED
jgi:hypothetical protein